jgi:hypothetical protein
MEQRTYLDPSDFAGALNDVSSYESGVTAHAGGGQANGYAITKTNTRVTTVATAADSLTLPVAKAGGVYRVFNRGANSLDVYPATGEAINALAANTALAVAAAGQTAFYCMVDGTWDAFAG